MRQEDVPAIAELETLCFSDPWSQNSIASELDNRLSYWLVAEDNDRIIGYVGSQSVLDGADMMNLAVATQYRRRGIAKQLVCSLVEKLRERSVSKLTLEVRASNLPAISLYESLGFVQVGRRPNYYSGPKEDALILRKEWEI